MIWGLLFGSLFTLAATGAALGAVLGLIGLLILQFFAGGITELAVQTVYNVFSSFTLSAVPMFVLLGELIVKGGLSQRIYGAVAPLFERIPGGLLHSNIVVCTLFGAVCGSSAATAAAVGSVAYPELKARGYRADVVAGSLAGGGTLGLLIPPSLSLIIYGAWQDVSVGRLFLAGILPGLLCAALFMAYLSLRATILPAERPVSKGAQRIGLSHVLEAWPLLVLIAAVLGSIYGGLATVTEAAGLGCLAALILGFAAGELTLRKTWQAVMSSVASFGAIKMVILGAVILGQAVSILGLPRSLIGSIADLMLPGYAVVGVVILLYLLLGCVLDGISLMLLTLPFVFPLFTGLGYDPVWLGIFITIMIEIGMLTPPVGVNLFVLSAVTRNDVPIAAIARAAVPYWIALLVAVALMMVFPEIALFLPDRFF